MSRRKARDAPPAGAGGARDVAQDPAAAVFPRKRWRLLRFQIDPVDELRLKLVQKERGLRHEAEAARLVFRAGLRTEEAAIAARH